MIHPNMDLPPPGRFAYAGDELVDAYERVQWQNLELARKMEYRDGYGERVHLRKYSDPRYTCPGSFAYMPDSSADHGGGARATAGGGESQKHMHAKYLLQKMAGRYRFLLSRCKSCDRCHVWENGQGLSGVVLEKRRAGFAYDVALMRGGEVSVALEVWHTHKTGKRKRETPRHGGVAFAEFDADEVLGMQGVKGVTTLTNLEVDVVRCARCKAERQARERDAVEKARRAREQQVQRQREAWLHETHVGNETRMIQCLALQVAIGHHALGWLARTVHRDQATQLPVRSCLRLVEDYQAQRHALQPDSVYQSKKIWALHQQLSRGIDCHDFMHVVDINVFLWHHRREWREISELEKERKQRHGVKPRYEQGNSFKCICKRWMLKEHRQQYLLPGYSEECRLEEKGAFVITARDKTYCYVCINCIGACGACGQEMLLDDCIQFGFCQKCNRNLHGKLFRGQRAFVHGGTVHDVRDRITSVYVDGYYDPDLERHRALVSIQAERSRVCREESERVEREKAAKEAARKAEVARREREEAARREREETVRREREEAFKARQRMQRPCRPMELKRETVQTPRQEATVVKKEPATERKHSSELARIASSRQKKEDRTLANCMQSWLKPRDGRAG